MTRRLLLLNGLAIIAIAIHHAGAYTLQAMFEWTDRYLPVAVPNYDQLGSPVYYIVMTLRLLLIWSVPAFLFISGYYAAFMARGKQAKLKWDGMLPRVRVLLFPFIVWTIVRYALLRKVPASLEEVLDPYHFVPVLIQFYLLAPLIVYAAKRNWKLVLAVAAITQGSLLVLRYLMDLGIVFPAQREILALTPRWFFISGNTFWFPFGIVFGLHLYKYQATLSRLKWWLLAGATLLGTLILVEYGIVDRMNGEQWLGSVFTGLSTIPFTIAIILCFAAFNDTPIPFSQDLAFIGARSLGIYMANIPFVYVVAVLMYRLTPWLLGYHLVYFTILFIAGLGGPLLLMEAVRRSPVHSQYRYVFG